MSGMLMTLLLPFASLGFLLGMQWYETRVLGRSPAATDREGEFRELATPTGPTGSLVQATVAEADHRPT